MPPPQVARDKLLQAATSMIRERGYAATTIDALCTAAGVTKGAFFHHFKSKDALGVAVAEHWTAVTSELFANAAYHSPTTPVDRLLAYVAYRKTLVVGGFHEFTCLVGTMLQELHAGTPDIRNACAASILGHAASLEADFHAALQQSRCAAPSAESLARHTQTVIQGAFILAKATNDSGTAIEALDHLDRYLRLLFGRPTTTEHQP